MNKKSRAYKVIICFFKKLLYVNIIGFVIGAFISGNEVLLYWENYFLYSSIIGMSLWLGNEYFSKLMDRKYSWFESPIKILVLRVMFSLIYSTIVLVILYMIIWFYAYKKPNLDNFYDSNKFSFLIFNACTIIITLIYHTIGFFNSWKTAALNEERLKKESISFQLQALRNQVDPHFLFNSLNTLTSLIETDSKKAITFVKQLSEMFRYMLDRDSKEMIEIESELKFVDAYVFLQKMRFGNNLKVEINLSEKDFYILPISLQMLIENAIKHNEVSIDFPLLVRIQDENDYVVIANRVQPKMLEIHSNGIGLQNLKTRYNFFTDKELIFETSDGEFVVKIPKLRISNL